MSGNKQLGVFFGNNSLSIVETDNQAAGKFFSAPHNLFDTPDPAKTEGQTKNVPDDIKLTAIIQKSLRDLKITSNEVSLSLPTKDIIFRSFIIPLMAPNEINGAVEFEARKYIPFKLDEISYTFHHEPTTEKTTKRIRILFVAIRNEVLEKYCHILEQSGLRITFIEPAPASIIRALVLKKLVPLDQRVAIVQTGEKDGKIIIVDHGIPQFVRDFQLSAPAASTPENDTELMKARLFNEVRISLDYYGRQYAQEQVHSLIYLSNTKAGGIAENLGTEIGLPIVSVDAQSVMDTQKPADTDLLCAYGIGLKEAVPALHRFDLSTKTAKSKSLQSKLARIKVDYMTLAKTAGVCVALIGLTYFLSGRTMGSYQQKVAQLKEKQGIYGDLPIDQIETKSQDVQTKIESYKNVRVKGDVTSILIKVPDLLLEGTWLRDLTIQYMDIPLTEMNARKGITEPPADPDAVVPQLSILLSGYAFLPNTSQQIRLVNSLVTNMKSDKAFMEAFTDIKLISAQTSQLQDHTLTVFSIRCE